MERSNDRSVHEQADKKTDRPNIDYFYDEHIGNYHYGPGHPMRPHRVRLTHHLIVNYGLYKHLNVFRPRPATFGDLTAFHTDEYIRFLNEVTPENMHESQYRSVLDRHNICEDCPIFDGLYEYCQTYTGGSIAGAARVNQGSTDIVVNWAGGLHHAKKGEASGFCYTNDIVLAILELLKVHSRVLYVDIDIHHGDGVEEAFYLTNRVMTLSFHQGNSFFPRTGHLNDTGGKMGKNYAVNFPLLAGMDDAAYEYTFKPVLSKAFEMFQPNAVVLCCGADSLSGDRVGCWNLSIKGHAAVLDYVKTFDVPMLVFGGGGYTIRNVARCWCYETSRLLNQPISEDVPYHEYSDYYLPEYKLHVPVSNMKNENTREYLDGIKQKIFEQLNNLEHVPNVQMRRSADQCRAVDDGWDDEEEDAWTANDERPHRMRRCHIAEFFDNDDGVEGDRMDTDRLGVRDFVEPPDACTGACSDGECTGSCRSAAPNPFVAALQAGRNPSR